MGGMHVTVKDKFSSRKECNPVIMTRTCKESKVLFDFLISTFDLSIRLGMVCSGKCMGDAKLLIQSFHELCRKLRASIGHDLGRDTMEAEYFLVMDVGNAFSIDVRCGRNDMYLFAVMVNIHNNCVISSGLRQSGD
jgi:hypothetical protein